MKNFTFLIIIVVVILGLLLIINYQIYRIGYHYGETAGYKTGQIDTLLSQSEVQEILGVPVDGWIGPESRRVWNEIIERRVCDDAALAVMEPFMRAFNERYFPGMELDD